ncbi:PREDICTED: receptor-binding cancer antigen expressed on SiSo cells [Acromyrmex echinatior]|uniref:Receptor-binding cancer antigen expressed on SiSo cells n=1 Tax=Acromyrmex echinatior TaxID=103372 RepID=F4WN57_ACREC|nr:PREDICTED: receptor-binding cancer antigen expressed on SiSo cells [Acromyrmex echinatior]EGI64326.1 Receptor-binding cancer antigen expressed on SiSo cells [Acromyrmex echinatior]
MAVEFLMNRLKALFVLLFGIFKRAMCCLRRRRRSSCDSVPLSTVGVVPNVLTNSTELEQWDKWEENPIVVIPDKPVNTVQAKIEQYRQQVIKPPESPTEEQLNFFEDMTPKITRQAKILIKDKHADGSSRNIAKFTAMDPVPTNELGEWEENSAGWEVDDFNDPTKVLREQRRREREQRLMEQQQKRLERTAKPQPLGAKLCS